MGRCPKPRKGTFFKRSSSVLRTRTLKNFTEKSCYFNKVSVKPFQRLTGSKGRALVALRKGRNPFSAFLFEAQRAALLFFFAPFACKEKASKRLYVTKSR